MSIVVLGTVALDSLKTPHGIKNGLLGGSAAHFSMSACHFIKVHIAAVVGDDFPRKYITMFKNKGINTDSLVIKEGKTFRWSGEYKDHDLNTAVTLETTLGVIVESTPTVTEAQKNIDNVFLANYDPDLQMDFLKQMKNPKFTAMDTMNLWINIKKKSVAALMKKSDLLVLNDAEARDFTEKKNLLQAAKALIKCGPKMVIIKKGEHGAMFYSNKDCFVLPAFLLENVVDPTGAGDTFAGGVMGYLAKVKKIDSKSIVKAICYGTMFSSFNVQGFGMDKTKSLTLSKVNERLKIFKKFFQF